VGCAGATAPLVLTAKEFAMVVCQLRIVHITDDGNYLQQRLEPGGSTVTQHGGCIVTPARSPYVYTYYVSREQLKFKSEELIQLYLVRNTMGYHLKVCTISYDDVFNSIQFYQI
jgi:hypothetical protein